MIANDDDEVIQPLVKKLEELEHQAAKLRRAIAAYRDGQDNTVGIRSGTAGATAPIVDICSYLKEQGRPVPQRDIIDTIGALRHHSYPKLKLHKSNIWKALEFHARHGKLICCIDPLEGTVTDLKPLQSWEKGDARYYQDNWFVLKEEMVEGRHISVKGRAFSQD